MEDMSGQNHEFLDVAKSKSGIQKSKYTGDGCSREMEHRH